MRPVPNFSSALPAGGGFFLPSYDSNPAAFSSSSSSTSLAPLPTEPQDALRLSPVQLTRLRSHLDSRILSIQRRWAKRFHHQQQQHPAAAAGEASATGSSSSAPGSNPLLSGGPPLDSVGKYVSAWTDEVLPLLVRVDPVGASQSTTLVAYAMRMTELLLMGLVGYESLEEREGEGEGSRHSQGDQGGHGGGERGEQQQRWQPPPQTSGLTRVLQALHLLDALWASLLAGRRLSLPHALARSSASLSLASSSSTSSTTSSAAAGLSGAPAAPTRDSLPLSGSLGIKTLSGTDRVRLRNLLVDRRSEVRRWVGDVLGVVLAGPAPGEEEREEEMRLLGRSLPGGASSRLNGVARGSMPPMQGRRKRGRAALVESHDSSEQASQRDGIAEEVKEESDAEDHTMRPAPAAAPEAKRRKRTRGDTKRAAQIKEEAIDDDVDEEDDEEEMEEVSVPAASGSLRQAEHRVKQEQGNEEEDKADEAQTETEEHRHYQALFDRKIELDDDDDDDEDDDDENGDEGEHEDADEGQDGGEAADPLLDPQETSLPAEINGDGSGKGNGNGNVNGSANGHDHGHGHADTGRLGSFELDVLLARLFSRSLALLERLE